MRFLRVPMDAGFSRAQLFPVCREVRWTDTERTTVSRCGDRGWYRAQNDLCIPEKEHIVECNTGGPPYLITTKMVI